MHRKLWIVALPLALSAVLAVLLAALGDDDHSSASVAARSAPIAPPRVPVRPPPVLRDAPGEAPEAEENRLVQLPLTSPDSFAPGGPARAAEFDVLTLRRGMRPRAERERLRLVAVNQSSDGSIVGGGPKRWVLLPR